MCVQYIGGYLEYIGGNIMIHEGDQVDKACDLFLKPLCTEHPPMYS